MKFSTYVFCLLVSQKPGVQRSSMFSPRTHPWGIPMRHGFVFRLVHVYSVIYISAPWFQVIINLLILIVSCDIFDCPHIPTFQDACEQRLGSCKSTSAAWTKVSCPVVWESWRSQNKAGLVCVYEEDVCGGCGVGRCFFWFNSETYAAALGHEICPAVSPSRAWSRRAVPESPSGEGVSTPRSNRLSENEPPTVVFLALYVTNHHALLMVCTWTTIWSWPSCRFHCKILSMPLVSREGLLCLAPKQHQFLSIPQDGDWKYHGLMLSPCVDVLLYFTLSYLSNSHVLSHLFGVLLMFYRNKRCFTIIFVSNYWCLAPKFSGRTPASIRC